MDESWTVESVECGAVEVLMSVGAGLTEQTSWPSSQSSCPSSQESSDLHALTFCKSSSSFWKKGWSLGLNVYRVWKMSIFQSNLFLKSVNRRETRISYNKRVIQVMNRGQRWQKQLMEGIPLYLKRYYLLTLSELKEYKFQIQNNICIVQVF